MLGQSAVSAGIIGAPMVIVIALTAITSFVNPSQVDSGAILRIIFLILAAVLGLFGITIGLLGLLIHLASLRSFGTPYLSPIAPLTPGDLKDSFIRTPLWSMLARPRIIVRENIKRQKSNGPPKPPSRDN